jgi:tetratricopeptide (TPR) repeat protein
MKKILLAAFCLCLLSACNNEPKQQAPQFGKTGNPQIDGLTAQIFKTPNNAQLYFQRAKLFYQNGAQGGYDYAIEDMKFALSLDSTNVPFHHFLSDIYLDYAQSRLAVTTMERASALAPNDIPTQLKLCQVYFITKQYGGVKATIDKILKQDPQNSEGYFMLGMYLKEQNDIDKATIAFQKAVDLDSDNKDAFIELGKIYTNKGNPLALKYFDNALIIDSLDFNVLMAKAYYFQTKNQKNEAIGVYKKIINYDPRYENALFNLGLLYFDMDSIDKAQAHFNMVIGEAPTFYKAYYYRGLIAEKQGDKSAALKDFKQCLEFNSTYDKAIDGVKRLSGK